MDRRRQVARGFTLLEVLLTAFVVAMSVLAGISTLTHTLRGVQDNKMTLFSKTATNRVLERIRNTAFTDPDGDTVDDYDDIEDYDGYTFQVSGLPGATGDVAVDDYGDPNVKRVIVTVEYDPSRSWSLTSLLTPWTVALAAASGVQYPPS